MPFIGVLPERASLFQPQPQRPIAVNDAAAWRLNPRYRHVYDKLAVAVDAGLRAAPCGVSPLDFGLAATDQVFVKPVINLAGTGLQAHSLMADSVCTAPGLFWCEYLEGEHSSTDCLVQAGQVRWFAHTVASREKDAARPLYWQIGVERPDLEPWITAWVARWLPGYTGLCNLELIGGRPIEAHLRGSNGFFDFYGPHFIAAWVAYVEGTDFTPPPPIPGGYVLSIFGTMPITDAQIEHAQTQGVALQRDPHTPGRAAILRSPHLEAAWDVYRQIVGA